MFKLWPILFFRKMLSVYNLIYEMYSLYLKYNINKESKNPPINSINKNLDKENEKFMKIISEKLEKEVKRNVKNQ